MDSQSAETSDSSLCLAALMHFLDRIDQDTKEWYYAINGDHNHPYSLCNILGLSFDDTMVILETCGLAKKSKNIFSKWAVEQKGWKKLIRFEVVHYKFQGNKDIHGNVIKCKKAILHKSRGFEWNVSGFYTQKCVWEECRGSA